MGCVSRVVKRHYWQPYRLAPLKISWPPLASPLKKAGAATGDVPRDAVLLLLLLSSSSLSLLFVGGNGFART